MKTFEIYSGSRPLLLAALLSALVVGCGGGGSDNQVPMAAGAHSKDGDGSGGGQVTPSHAPVNLGAAGTFAILSKSGVTDV
jgi:hypothetical protein